MKEIYELIQAREEVERRVLSNSPSSGRLETRLRVTFEILKTAVNYRELDLKKLALMFAGAMGFIFSIVAALAFVIVALIPPYISETYFWLIPVLITLTLTFPLTSNFVRRHTSQQQFVYGRIFVVFVLFNVAMNIHPHYRAAQVSTLSKAEQIEMKKKDEAWEKEQAKKRADAVDRKQAEQDAEIENKAQEKFYKDLSAPKLLYRCKGGLFTKAIGANIGTFNRLLADAIEKCGQGNVEILDSDK